VLGEVFATQSYPDGQEEGDDVSHVPEVSISYPLPRVHIPVVALTVANGIKEISRKKIKLKIIFDFII
jgi:uncharacterized membrane protein